MGKPFKVSQPAPAPPPPVAPTPPSPMQVLTEAQRTGLDVTRVGHDRATRDGELPIPYPAAQPVTQKPFKVR